MSGSGKASNSRRAVVNMLTLAGGHSGSTIVLLATTPYFFSTLGPSKYGLWILFSSLVQYASIVDVGLGPGLTKYVAEDHARNNRDHIRQMVTFATLFYFCAGLVIFTLVALFGHVIVGLIKMPADLRADAYPLLLWMVGYFFVLQQAGTLHNLLTGLGKLNVSATVRACGLILSVMITVVALRLGFGLAGMLATSFLVVIGSIPIVMYFVRKEFGSPYCAPAAITWPPVRRLFATGGWMQMSSIMILIYTQSSGVIVGMVVNVAAVALYDLASRLSRLLRALSYYMNGALFPAMSALEARSGKAAIDRVLVDGSRYVCAITFSAAGFLVAAAPIIFSAWLGSGRAGQSLSVLVMLLTALCITATIENCIAVPLTMLRAIGLPKLEAFYTATTAVFNITLSVILVPRFGVIGVVFGTMLGSLVGTIIFIQRFSRLQEVSVRDIFVRPIAKLAFTTIGAATVTWFAAGFLLRYGIPQRPLAFAEVGAIGVLYAAVYLALLGVTGFLRAGDLEFVKRVLPTRFAATPVDRRILRFLFAGR